MLTATKADYPFAVLTTQAAFISDADLVEKIVADCKKAVADYFRYVPAELNDVEGVITDAFYYRLACDYVENKKTLREFLRRSPAWNEELQALVINGNRTHVFYEKEFYKKSNKFLRIVLHKSRLHFNSN